MRQTEVRTAAELAEAVAAESEVRIREKLTEELGIRMQQTEAVLRLIGEGNTIPFIARYRKEATGGLKDGELRCFDERLAYLRGLWDRKKTALSAIFEQGKLDEALEEAIKSAETLIAVEDLYRPYKQKKRTRAMIARERGLEPLAVYLLRQKAGDDPKKEASAYISEERGVPDADAALLGACDIIAEGLSDRAELRSRIREKTQKAGRLLARAKDAEKDTVYRLYYDFSEPLKKLSGHQILAINRGEKEKVLTVKIEAPDEELLAYMERGLIKNERAASAAYLRSAASDAYKRLIFPSVETEIRGILTERAEEGAIRIFQENLRGLLMQPPIEGKTVLGWDPAFRTGCKLSVVDTTGKVLDTCVIYPTAPQNKVKESLRVLKSLILKYKVDVISLGNGTASRESEAVISELLREPEIAALPREIGYVIVNEAGASVYSASKQGAEEFPQFDVGQRSSVSIARRLQDPLSELVKIEPRSVGVGQYQHDINQTRLSEALNGVVESCVNSVGVDLNTASAALLGYVSGVNRQVAANIVAYREENGRFPNRRALLKVPKLGPKAYEQCAGFLRIRGGSNPLDMTGVHPESYEACGKLLAALGKSAEALSEGGLRELGAAVQAQGGAKKLAESLGIGLPTFRDMIAELEKPMRDPREEMPKPVLSRQVLEMKDLVPGMRLTGTVRNVIDFGAFVDIGVHQDGLVHISELADHFVKHPREVVKLGDIVTVRVLEVDQEKKRIALSMRGVQGESKKP